MPTAIHERVRRAQQGQNSQVIAKLPSGWVVAGEVQPVPGYCLLLSDPVAPDLNALDDAARVQYCRDMILVGDALLKVTAAYRINYETWGNVDQALHTHIVPRYMTEAEDQRRRPIMMAYDWQKAAPFAPEQAWAKEFVAAMRQALGQ